MTSPRSLSQHFNWFISGSSLTTLVVAASLLVLPSNRSQAADEVRGPGVAQQAVDQSRADELRAKQQKLDADNKAIDAGMKEARNKANNAMDAATREMATGVAGGTAATAAGVAGGTPAAQGQAQQGQAGLFASVAALVAQRDDLSRALVNQLANIGDKLAQKQDAMARESELKSKRAQRDQLDKQILDQLAAIRKSSQGEAQTARERMKSLQEQSEARLKEQAQKAKEAKDDRGMGQFGTIFGGPLIGTAIGKEIAGVADTVQRAKATEAQAVKTEIAILAAKHDEMTKTIAQLNAEAQKAKGSKANEMKAEMAALVGQRNKLNESIGAQTAELRKVKDAEREAADRRLKQINSMQDAVKREAAEREAASKKGKAADRAEAQSQMQQLKALQDALNGSASAQKQALSQIAAEQSEVAKREALHKKIAEGLRANPSKLDALIIPKDSGKGGAQAGGKGGVAGYAGLTAETLAAGKGGGGANAAVAKALKQIQDKTAEKRQGSGNNAAEQLRAAQEKAKDAAASKAGNEKKADTLLKEAAEKAQQQKLGKSESGADKKSGSRLDTKAQMESQRLAKPEGGAGKKSGSRIETQAQTESKRLATPRSGADKKPGSRTDEAAKAMQEKKQGATLSTTSVGRAGSKIDDAAKAKQTSSSAGMADQIKRMQDANRQQKLDQMKATGAAISARCPNPPCNVVERTPAAAPPRAPSISAMDRLGGGPSPTLAGTKAAVGAKANSKANSSQNSELEMIKLQQTMSKRQQAIQTMQNIQQKQQESTGAAMRNVR